MKIFKLILFASFLCLANVIFSQDLISVTDLAAKLKSENLVIIQCGATEEYKAHLPNAVNMPHTILYNNIPVKNVIKPDEEMAIIFGQKGVSPDKEIVLYDEGSGKYSGRMYWILKYLGAPDVKILNGNLKAWKAARKPLSAAPSTLKPASFTPDTNTSDWVSLSDVQGATGNANYVIIDCRTTEEYEGKAETELRKGHIPGAVNINYASLLDANGLYKSKEELTKIFTEKGVVPEKTMILYCETSIRAGVEYFALKSILGYPNVKVYDGAYLEWQSVADNIVDNI